MISNSILFQFLLILIMLTSFCLHHFGNTSFVNFIFCRAFALVSVLLRKASSLVCGSKLFLYHSRGETIGCQNNFYLLYFYSSITCLSFLCFFVVGLFSFRAATKSICKSWTWNLIDVCAVGDVFDWKSFPKFYYLICMSFICAIWITLYNIMLFLVVNLYVPYLCVYISQKKK